MENGKKKKHSFFDSFTVSGMGSSRKVVKNAISKSFGAVTEKFVYASTRSYGIMGLAFGLLSLFIYLGKYYILISPDLPIYELFIGLGFAIISVPMLLFDKPLCQMLQNHALTDYILFDFFSIKRMDKNDSAKGISAFTALLIGFLPAIITAFIPTVYVLLAAAIIIFISISFVTPEFTVIFTVLIAPYLSPVPDNGLILALLAALSTFSFITKLIIGKRFYKFEIYDFIFIIFMVILAVSGFITGTASAAFIMFALTLGYILSSNLVANKRLADCVVNALIVSNVPISVFAIIKYIYSLATSSETITNSVIFASEDSFCAFLLLGGIFAFAYARGCRRKSKKTAYGIIAFLNFINIILAWQIGVWLTLVLCIPAYAILNNSKIRKEWVLMLLALPYLLFLLPDSFMKSLSDTLSLSPEIPEIINSMKGGFEIFRENIFFGIGFTDEIYVSNTFLSSAVSFGVIITVILILLFLIRLVHLSLFASYVKNSPLSVAALAGMLSTFALFSLGMTADIFSDITLFYLFSSVFGLVSASLRIAKNEYDERIGYYGTIRSDDSSDVSIRISV